MKNLETHRNYTTWLRQRFEGRYQYRHGVVAGYLPEQAEYISIWLSDQVKEALNEKEQPGFVWQPSILEMMKYLNVHSDLRKQVEEMIQQGLEVHKTYEPDVPYHIDSLEVLYLTLNRIIQRPPIFAPEIPHTAFPVSGTFVYMMFTEAGWDVFRNPGFNDQLRNVLDAWCRYLDSKESLWVVVTDPKFGWLSPASVLANSLDQFVTQEQKEKDPVHWGFKSFNGFFHRKIIPLARPLEGLTSKGEDNKAVVVSPNDGTVNRLVRGVQRKTNFELKCQPYSLEDMLDHSPYVDRFVGGDVLQTFLSGHDYHRWHAPVSGTIKEMKIIPAFMFSELLSEGFDSSAGTLSQVYEANVNTRALIFIESKDKAIGMVCVIPIGITEISSIKFNEKISVGDYVEKGTLLGRFSYGGSSLATVFQPGAIQQFTVVEPGVCVNSNNGPIIRVKAQIAIANTSETNQS